jgi:transcriptional regulator with XRE-family HTH domain
MNDEMSRGAVRGRSVVEAPVGFFVRQLRLSQGLTLEELARRVGCVKGYLSAIERGLRPPPGRAIAERLERELRAPAGVLVRAGALARMPAEIRAGLESGKRAIGGAVMVEVEGVESLLPAWLAGCWERLIGYRVRDGGMEPVLSAGDWVFVSPEAKAGGVSGPRLGVVRFTDGRPWSCCWVRDEAGAGWVGLGLARGGPWRRIDRVMVRDWMEVVGAWRTPGAGGWRDKDGGR